MAGEVRFDEENTMQRGMPQIRSKTMADMLVRWGIVRSQNQGYLLLLIVAVALFALSYYLFMYAIPSEPTLGGDVLRPGENVPSYVNQKSI
jgi:hypothetical protein